MADRRGRGKRNAIRKVDVPISKHRHIHVMCMNMCVRKRYTEIYTVVQYWWLY